MKQTEQLVIDSQEGFNSIARMMPRIKSMDAHSLSILSSQAVSFALHINQMVAIARQSEFYKDTK